MSLFIPDDFKHKNIQFVKISAPDELSLYPSGLFIFEAGLLEKHPYPLWQTSLKRLISLSEQHLEIDTDLLAPTNFPKRETLKLINFACQQLITQHQYQQSESSLDLEHHCIGQLNEISIALSKEKNLGTLLRKILLESQNLSDCDAVSLYLVDKEDEKNPSLIFKLSFNDTLNFSFNEFHIPLDNQSIAGYAALNNTEVVIDDAYHICQNAPYKFDSSLDEKLNYRTLSILAVPITNYKHQAIGVLQFINRKRSRQVQLNDLEITKKNVIPFNKSIIHLLSALASQAAISIENTMLIQSVNNLFEGFVQASVTAIEQRDPTTSGHSFRVADLTTALAQRVTQSHDCEYQKIHYTDSELREIRYASLLHDFGKVGVRESVLVKAKKLPENRIEVLHYRFELEKKRLQGTALSQELHALHNNFPLEAIAVIHRELKIQLKQLDDYFQAIVEANEPSILDNDKFNDLKDLTRYHFDDFTGETQTLISNNDFLALSIKRGTLTKEERDEIQSHVLHTLSFLNKIPWTQDLSSVPKIASAHHEKLNGEGYPYGLKEDDICIPSRMMSICDIYDALVATDRPYKSSIKAEKALEIIQSEADHGILDQELVKIFIDEDVFSITQHKDYRPSMSTSKSLEKNHICHVKL